MKSTDVGSTAGVDVQDRQTAILVCKADAEIVAAWPGREVRDAVGIDLAAQDADRRRVHIMRGNRDISRACDIGGCAADQGGDGGGGGECELEHVVLLN